jgi:hypothetical protein
MSEKAPTAMLLTFARRGEEAVIADVLAWLRGEWQGVRVAAVGTPVSAPMLQELGVDEVIEFGDGQGAKATLREAKTRGPVAAAIIYGGPGFGAHLKLELLALGIGARRTYRFAPGQPPQAVGRAGLLASVVGKSARAAACLVWGAIVCEEALFWLVLAQAIAGRGGGRAQGTEIATRASAPIGAEAARNDNEEIGGGGRARRS